MVVQHNLTAMNSNRMLGLTVNSQAKSTERLSSGYKINRAADDASGLAISEKMRKQVRGLTQASANAQDGISAVQTAEGALNEVQDMLQRMNELAVKAANGTNSESDRTAIQNEIDQLVTEIDRVAETTKFNETYLLKGSTDGEKNTKFAYQEAKVTSKDLYYLKDGEVQTVKAGTYKEAIDASLTYFETANGKPVGDKIETDDNEYLDDSVEMVTSDSYTKAGNDYVLAKGEKYSGNDNDYYKVTFGTDGKLGTAEQKDPTTEDAYELKKDAYDEKGNTVAKGTILNAADAAKLYKTKGYGKFDVDDAISSLDDVTTKASVKFTDKDGNEISENALYKYLDNDGKLKENAGLYMKGEGEALKVATQEDVDALVDSSTTHEKAALTMNLHVGADATRNNQIDLTIDAMSASSLGVDGLKIDGADDTNARNAIETIKAAIQKVSDQRAQLGAVQNRLDHTINNLDNVVENTTSAESQIRDTDMATEMVKYANNNILAQAGQSMLAQANQSNQGVLSLLG